jgi:hypothetical protein
MFFLMTATLAAETVWNVYDLRVDPEAGGLEISVKYPANFLASPQKASKVIKQFDKKLASGAAYLTVANIELPSILVSAIKEKGSWPTEMLEKLWSGIAGNLDGLEGYEIMTYKDLPACEVELLRNDVGKDKYDWAISARFVIYKNSIIKLECGQYAPEKDLLDPGSLAAEICRPFFDSLVFY